MPVHLCTRASSADTNARARAHTEGGSPSLRRALNTQHNAAFREADARRSRRWHRWRRTWSKTPKTCRLAACSRLGPCVWRSYRATSHGGTGYAPAPSAEQSPSRTSLPLQRTAWFFHRVAACGATRAPDFTNALVSSPGRRTPARAHGARMRTRSVPSTSILLCHLPG